MRKNNLYFYPEHLDHCSISSLQSFENCPLNFYLRYYHHIKFPDKPQMIFGSLFQELLNKKYAGESLRDALDSMNEEDRKLSTTLIRKAQDFKNIVSIDSPYVVDLGFGIPFKFVPDLVTEDDVVENKVTSGYYNQKMVASQKQGTLYHVGMLRLTGKPRGLIYQIFNKVKKDIKVIELTKNQKDIDELYAWVDKTLIKVDKCHKTGSWDIGSHAFFDCDLGKSCPIKYGRITNLESAEKFVYPF